MDPWCGAIRAPAAGLTVLACGKVFNDQEKLQLLNSLVHPATIKAGEQ